jgi:hypothetical protein
MLGLGGSLKCALFFPFIKQFPAILSREQGKPPSRASKRRANQTSTCRGALRAQLPRT